MINVNQITSQLAKMPDQALQQYAAMHKNDPYTVSLALAESNRRKEMRAGAMAGGQTPPKVVDQDIAGMAQPAQQLPEDVGIGQLPAENMQGMAGGGIVAFEEGGEVPRFANTGLVDGGMYFDPNTGEAVMGEQYTPQTLEAIKRAINYGAALPKPATPTTPTTPAAPVRMDANTDPRVAKMQAGIAAGFVPQNAPAGDKLPPEKPTAAPAAPGGTGLGGYEKRYADMLSKGEVSKEDRMKEFADIDKPAIDKMQSMINTQKDKLSSDKEQDFYMSLIQGGLAAAGGTSQHALQNIAQGFEKGAGNYASALKDLRKAAQENSKMEMELARYESTGKKDALKAYYDHQDKVQGYKAQGIAQIMGHEISASATTGAANIHAAASRDTANMYRAPALVENIRKNIETSLSKQPAYMADPAALDAEVQRRLNIELQKNPNLAQYASTTQGSAAPATSGWGQATVKQTK